MKVELIACTERPCDVVYAAARLCYKTGSASDAWTETFGTKDSKIGSFLAKLRRSGHMSPFEHASFTFAVNDVSRVTTHQLVRHRLASYSQQSQRYVSVDADDDSNYEVPLSIVNTAFEPLYIDAINNAKGLYRDMVAKGIPKEDARYILPSCVHSNIIVTMNARELMHFYDLRGKSDAQWEIQDLAEQMMDLAKDAAKELFE